jgi:Fe-S oxidoreductase
MIEIIEPNSKDKTISTANIVTLKYKIPRISLKEIKNNLKNLRENSIQNLEELVDQFIKACSTKKVNVYLAETSKQAAEYVLEIAEKDGCDYIYTNRSLVAETVKNEIIKIKPIPTINTYTDTLGDMRKPPLKNYAKLFSIPEEIVWGGFKISPKKIKNFDYKKSVSISYLGLLGVTAASADGTLVYLQHFENISNILNGAKVLVHVIPVEKIVKDKNVALFEAKCCGLFGFKTISLDINTLSKDSIVKKTRSDTYELGDFINLPCPKDSHVIILNDGRKEILKTSYKDLLYCISCKSCQSICPWAQLEEEKRYITPRDLLLRRLDVKAPPRTINNYDDVYNCCMCNACSISCPLGLDLSSFILEVRSNIVEEGRLPRTIRDALTSTYKYGNPYNMPPIRREEWCKDVKIKKASEEKADTLLYICCALAFDPKNHAILKSLVSILKKMDVDFCILGDEEKCCGDHILRLGEKGMFDELRDYNTATIKKYDIQRIITLSPHCYDAFKHNYTELRNIEVQHYTEFLYALLKNTNIEFPNIVNKKIVYHDPCFLGRYNGVYEEPRKILELIPGINLEELPRNKENSFCCGGGGGRNWIEEPREKRISIIRAQEIANINPDIVAVSCPFCKSMLEDALIAIGQEHIQVKDIIELLAQATLL